MVAFAGECQQVFMAPVFTLHAGKAVVHIPAIQIPVNDLLQIRTPQKGQKTG
jgi:hypothetical protein